MNGTKQEVTAEQALGILDALLAEVKQPPLSRNDQIAIQAHVKTVLTRLEQDAATIQGLQEQARVMVDELSAKQKYILQLEKQMNSTDPPPELTGDPQPTNGALQEL